MRLTTAMYAEVKNKWNHTSTLYTHFSLTWAGSGLCFWFLCMCVAFPIAFCFNLYCGGFILFCSVCVCVCVCLCGFCNVWVFW